MSILALPTMPEDVAAVFASYPSEIGARLADVRRLIFRTAASTPGVGVLVETLKWGEPAYLTTESRSGITVRLGWLASHPEHCAVYVSCKTSVIETCRSLFSEELTFSGKRAILLDTSHGFSEQPLGICLAIALTYHQAKRHQGLI